MIVIILVFLGEVNTNTVGCISVKGLAIESMDEADVIRAGRLELFPTDGPL